MQWIDAFVTLVAYHAVDRCVCGMSFTCVVWSHGITRDVDACHKSRSIADGGWNNTLFGTVGGNVRVATTRTRARLSSLLRDLHVLMLVPHLLQTQLS